MIVDVNVGYDLIERVTVSCDSPDIAIDMTLGGDISIVQSDLAAHKIATNPHNITPAGIGALSVVAHDSSLNGDGTTVSPLSVAPVYAEVTTQANVASVDITQDINGNPFSIVSGESVEIIIKIDRWVNDIASRLYLRLNGISSSVYRQGNMGLIPYIILAGTTYYNGHYMVKLYNYNGYAIGITNAWTESLIGTFGAFPQMYHFRVETTITDIAQLTLYTISGNVIPAGTKFIVKKC